MTAAAALAYHLHCHGFLFLLLGLLPLASSGATLSPLCSMAGSLSSSKGHIPQSTAPCDCLEGWRGETCSTLDLEPAASVGAIQAWAPKGRTAWGGTVVKDPGGGGWHMFAAVMERNLSLSQGWEAHSTIEHLHSAHSPAGPFTALGMVKTAEAHNPSVAYDPHSKQYCIYYIGRSPIAGPPETPAYPTGIADIAVTCAPSPDGWADGGPLVQDGPFPLVPHRITPPRWDNWIQNPEPLFAPNGSVTLILNSNQHNNSLPIGQDFSHRGITMATAPSWRGPFTLASDVLFKPPNADGITPWGPETGKWIGDEDPCIFRQCSPKARGDDGVEDCAYHILTHQLGPGAPGENGQIDGAACNGHAFAKTLRGPWTWVNRSAYQPTLSVCVFEYRRSAQLQNTTGRCHCKVVRYCICDNDNDLTCIWRTACHATCIMVGCCRMEQPLQWSCRHAVILFIRLTTTPLLTNVVNTADGICNGWDIRQ